MKMNRFLIPGSFLLLFHLVIMNTATSDIEDSGSSFDLDSASINGNGCNRTIDLYRTVREPHLNQENRGRPLHCVYRIKIRPVRDDWIVSMRFTRMKVGRVAKDRKSCHGGYLQILDGHSSNATMRKDPGFFCGEIDTPKTFIAESSTVKVVFHSDSYSDDDYFQLYVTVESSNEFHSRISHQHHHMHAHRRGSLVSGSYCDRYFENCNIPGHCFLQSPGFPGIYARNLKCRYLVKNLKNRIGMEIVSFDVDGQECDSLLECSPRPATTSSEECKHDFVRIYDGSDVNTSPVIATICGRGRLPTSIIASGSEMLLEFVTSPAAHLINTGFQMKAESVFESNADSEAIELNQDGSCFISRQINLLGNFDTDPSSSSNVFTNIRSWYPVNTTCTYKFWSSGANDRISLHFLWFRIDRITLCEEFISIYDSNAADESQLLNRLCDSNKPMGGASKSSYISSGPALLVQFTSRTGSLSGASIHFGIDIKVAPKATPSSKQSKSCPNNSSAISIS